ncbi:MAG: formyltetrahydrofolate deformylase, partial [Acidimicrobiales bacterium]
TLKCVDVPGIVRATSAAIVALNGNILENDQFTDPVTSQFCMRTRFETEIDDVEQVRSTLEDDLQPFTPTLGVRLEHVRRRVLVMVSTSDHCLAELLYRQEQGDLPADIVAVVSNHPNASPLAGRYQIPFHEIPVTDETRTTAEKELRSLLEQYEVDFVVLARYMQVLSRELCSDFAGRIINIHHSFLPGFKGARPYHQAYEKGVKLIGATAHFVTADLDEGPIIEQDVVRVSHARVPSDLVSLGRDIERSVLARAVKLVAEDRVALVGNRTVIFSQ